ncbi:maf protein [Salinisphaera dokdonensis CL-ES53]|uniref:7-methyl-GTP pyrophosphatase n=1 Tax=Salinisphaera dokdonensis CL-ES53 TaxID=1304272 RepID=A0ABV2B2J4_9GAMM
MAPANPGLIILASSSPWRRQLMRQLQIKFEATSPDVDETAQPQETPIALARRLAITKAQSVAEMWPEAIVIGADQVADVNGIILGKPGTRENAKKQLRQQSGQSVLFHSGLCVCAPGFDEPLATVETVTTRFRELSDAQIERYVQAEDVTATAGSIKSEGLGITLVEAIESSDPSALVGLPLIALRRFLEQAGVDLP